MPISKSVNLTRLSRWFSLLSIWVSLLTSYKPKSMFRDKCILVFSFDCQNSELLLECVTVCYVYSIHFKCLFG